MLVTFSRQNGNIVSLSEGIDSFNNKTVKIKDVSLIKYIALKQLDKSDKVNRLMRTIYSYDDQETAVLTEVHETKQGTSIFKQGNIEFFNNAIEDVSKLDTVKVYKTTGKYAYFPDDFKQFNIDEIMREHYQVLLEESECTYAIADNFSYLKNIIIGESTFKTIQQREIVLAPGDVLKFKSEDLQEPANIFKILDINKNVTIYINDIELEGILQFKKPINKINITFKNNTDSDVILDSVIIGYLFDNSEGVD